MNKETIYKKVQDLFPTELGVGDYLNDKYHRVIEIRPKTILVFNEVECQEYWWGTPDNRIKLIRKRITKDMVLGKMNEINKNLSEWDKWHYSLFLFEGCIGIDATKYRESDGKCIKLISMKWILGKPLYDQSIGTIKLVYEVLK